MRRWGAAWPSGFVLALAASLILASGAAGDPRPLPDRVVIDLGQPFNTVVPIQALGAALDGMEAGEVNLYLTPFNVSKMRSTGLRRIAYRTRPELGIETWHWTETGVWSDPVRREGYWTGDPGASGPATVTWGYRLPRRGDSIDNAGNDGFSRLDDGDPASFWKSNPYLDRRFTGLPQSRPQWVVLAFGAPTPIDAARVLWGAPYARRFLIQYGGGEGEGGAAADAEDAPGRWITFPDGDRTLAGEPGEEVMRLADAPIVTRFVRILLLQSSETSPRASADVRDRLGYAIREVGFGRARPDGGLDDAVRHAASGRLQTRCQVSSTDPWHRAADRDRDVEQPSLDRVFASGLTGGAPMMAPVGLLYDTPGNAAAEVRYIRRRGWPVADVELGEEPDGQYVSPEDYADLYIETARALRAVDPALRLGGPSMQSAITSPWLDADEGASWPGRFVARLRARGALEQLQFFSFENYAFDRICGPPGELLRRETVLFERIMARTAAAGVPRSIPWVISEYGLSPYAGRAMSDLPGALMAADTVGHFLGLGGAAAFMFGLTPDQPANQNYPCAGYGNMMLFQAGDDGRSRWPMPLYYAQRMMVEDWGAPAARTHRLFAARSTLNDEQGRPFVVAYPLLGPGGRWSVMLVNRDDAHAHAVEIGFQGPVGGGGRLVAVSAVQYSPAQYKWLDRGEASRPIRDLPPRRFRPTAGGPLTLPAMSLTVVAGEGPSP